MAELLDTKRINIGDTWWVHHDEAYQDKEALAIKFPNPWDHRRNWDEGRVVQVDRDQGRFGVVLQQRSNAPRVPFFGKLNSFLGGRIGSVARRGSVAPSLAPIGDKGDGGSKPSSRMSSRTGSRTATVKERWLPSRDGGGGAQQQQRVQHFPQRPPSGGPTDFLRRRKTTPQKARRLARPKSMDGGSRPLSDTGRQQFQMAALSEAEKLFGEISRGGPG